jgi:hypothetical protein
LNYGSRLKLDKIRGCVERVNAKTPESQLLILDLRLVNKL